MEFATAITIGIRSTSVVVQSEIRTTISFGAYCTLSIEYIESIYIVIAYIEGRICTRWDSEVDVHHRR